MKTQWDGLRVCPQDFDKRHPQDAVRERDVALCAQKADSGGLDWSGSTNYTPDLDPTSFIQEPNDEYFTNPPEGTFGEVAFRIPDDPAPSQICSWDILETDNAIDPDLLFWHTATPYPDFLNGDPEFPRSNIQLYQSGTVPPTTYNVDEANCGKYVYEKTTPCAYSTSTYPWGLATGGKPVQWVCDSYTNNDGNSYPAFQFTPDDGGFGTKISFSGSTSSRNTNYITAILVFQLDETATTSVLWNTDSGGFPVYWDTSTGLYVTVLGDQAWFGYYMSTGSSQHPEYPTVTSGPYIQGYLPISRYGINIVMVEWGPFGTKFTNLRTDQQQSDMRRFIPKIFNAQGYSSASSHYDGNLQCGTDWKLYEEFVAAPYDKKTWPIINRNQVIQHFAHKYDVPISNNWV